jgi:hypothetical protein
MRRRIYIFKNWVDNEIDACLFKNRICLIESRALPSLQNGHSVVATVGSAAETAFLKSRVGRSGINLNFSTYWKRRPRNCYIALGNKS